MYDPSRQYRCPIIRGKSKTEMDDMLPAYAKVIDEICPCKAEDFDTLFNSAFVRYIPADDNTSRIKKTLDNHRTEIAGKLFGMYYRAFDGYVYETERTQKYLNDNDQPAFFKDLCYKMQFPSGMATLYKNMPHMENAISIRPLAFVIKMLQIASVAHVDIYKSDIGYYMLNSLDVLQGTANPYEVLSTIAEDHNRGIRRKVSWPGKAESYNVQHINEQINYLELANLIRVDEDKRVFLNPGEKKAIDIFAEAYDKAPEFDFYGYDFTQEVARRDVELDWVEYYGKLSPFADQFATSVSALVNQPEEQPATNTPTQTQHGQNNVEFGDEGEQLVYEHEKARVASFNPHLARKVIPVGRTHGIGYDIQSVIALPGDSAEFVKYIEVKSTKRLTPPNLHDDLWIDTINITRNEWIAAKQHRGYYEIFRVYFTQQGIFVYVLSDPMQKIDDNKMMATPLTYRLDFSASTVDSSFTMTKEA